MEKIIAVVVTYNRINCLKKLLKALKKQTVKLETIIVVNNDSTDGTREYLSMLDDIIVINQENIGGSGGFWSGLIEASRYASDWIWCMDDDVYPRADCLEQLLKFNSSDIGILCPRRIQDGKVFYSEYKKLNLSNPFKPLHYLPLNDDDIIADAPVSIEGMVFEGPLIKRKIIDEIGFPNKELFIFYDDTDYSYRTVLAGYKVLYVPSAIMDKEFFNKHLSREAIVNRQRWKTWYHIRNTAYFVNKYAKNSLFKNMGELQFPVHLFFAILFNLLRNKKYEFSDIKKLVLAYRYGKMGKLGKMPF